MPSNDDSRNTAEDCKIPRETHTPGEQEPSVVCERTRELSQMRTGTAEQGRGDDHPSDHDSMRKNTFPLNSPDQKDRRDGREDERQEQNECAEAKHRNGSAGMRDEGSHELPQSAWNDGPIHSCDVHEQRDQVQQQSPIDLLLEETRRLSPSHDDHAQRSGQTSPTQIKLCTHPRHTRCWRRG